MPEAAAALCPPAHVALETGECPPADSPALRESQDSRIGRNLSNHLVQWFGSSDSWGHFGNMEGEAFLIVTRFRGMLLTISKDQVYLSSCNAQDSPAQESLIQHLPQVSNALPSSRNLFIIIFELWFTYKTQLNLLRTCLYINRDLVLQNSLSCALVWKITSLKAELPAESESLKRHTCVNLHLHHCIHADSMYRCKLLPISFCYASSYPNIYMLKHILLCYNCVIFIFIYQLGSCIF